jgi:hypothetical protein
VQLGTSSSISPGASCPSDCANGRTGSNHWDLVLVKLIKQFRLDEFNLQSRQLDLPPFLLLAVLHLSAD